MPPKKRSSGDAQQGRRVRSQVGQDERVEPTEPMLEENAKTLAEALLEARPPITDEEIKTSNKFNGNWFVDGDDKAEARRLLEESDEYNTLDRLKPNEQVLYQFRMMYRTFIRIFRTSPAILISPICNLRYGPRQSAKTCHAVFSSGFSKQMLPLLVHPAWQQNYKMFRAAIQFAVLCRMDRRQPWPLTDTTLGFRTLAKLRKACRELDRTPIDVPAMLSQAIQETSEIEEFPAFLLSIADHVESVPDDDTRRDGTVALPVQVKDLESIEKALDSFEWENVLWRAGSKRIWDAFKNERGRQHQEEYPKDRELRHSLEMGLQYLFQMVVKCGKSRSNQTEPLSVPTGPERVVVDDDEDEEPEEGLEDGDLEDGEIEDGEIEDEEVVETESHRVVEPQSAGAEDDDNEHLSDLDDFNMNQGLGPAGNDTPEPQTDHPVDLDDRSIPGVNLNTNRETSFGNFTRRLNLTPLNSSQRRNVSITPPRGATLFEAFSQPQNELIARVGRLEDLMRGMATSLDNITSAPNQMSQHRLQDQSNATLLQGLKSIEDVVKRVDSHVNRLQPEGQRAEFEQLQEELLQASSERQELQSEIAELRQALKDKETSEMSLKEQLKKVKDTNKTLNDEAGARREETSELERGLRSEIAELKESLAVASASKNNSERMLAQVQEQLGNASTNNAALEGDKVRLTSEIKTLKGQMYQEKVDSDGEIAAERRNANERISTLEVANTQADETIRTLRSDNATMQKAMNELQALVNELQDRSGENQPQEAEQPAVGNEGYMPNTWPEVPDEWTGTKAMRSVRSSSSVGATFGRDNRYRNHKRLAGTFMFLRPEA